MKKIIVLSLLLWSCLAEAQYNFCWIKPFGLSWKNNKVLSVQTTSEATYFIGESNTANNGSTPCVLYKLKPEGSFTFTENVNYANSLQIDKSLIFTNGYYFDKRDLAGNLLSSSPLYYNGGQWTFYVQDSKISNDNIYAISQGDHLYNYDLQGNHKWDISLNSVFNCVVTTQQINFSNNYLYLRTVFYGNEEGGRLLKIDTSGNIIWKSPGLAIKIVNDTQGNTFLLEDYSVTKINTNGVTEWSKDIDRLILKDAFIENDTIYACGEFDVKNPPDNEDRHCGIAVASALTGEVLSQQDFNFFTEAAVGTNLCGEGFNVITKSGADLYLGGVHGNEAQEAFLVKLSTNPPTAIPPNSSNPPLLNIFPNPTGRAFTLSYKGPAQALKMEVKNALGQSIYSRTFYASSESFSENIDLGQQSKGVYFVEVSGNGVIERRKIVVE